MACATDSRRAEDAGHRHSRAHRLPYSANPPPATDSKLEDLSSQPPRPTGGDRFLHCANGHTMQVLFVFIVVLHFNVTAHPTAAWTSQQIVEAFANRDAPRYLLRDRDAIYRNEVRRRIASLCMEEILTAPRSPRQNPYAERLIGSIRNDISAGSIFGEPQLRFGDSGARTTRQSVWPKSVTHVTGTLCNPCLRAGPIFTA
jgi:hypothetical protein